MLEDQTAAGLLAAGGGSPDGSPDVAAGGRTGKPAIEEAMEDSGEKYRILLDSIDEGFCTLEVYFDAQGKAVDYRLLETNRAFERQTGLKNAAGKTLRELLARPEPIWVEAYGGVARTGEPIRFEHQAAELGKFFEVSAFRIGAPEEHRVAVLFNDIMDRKRAEAALRESEQRFRLFVTAGSDVLYRMSADWSEMRSLDGKSLLADARTRGRTWMDQYVPAEDKPLVAAATAEAVRDRKTFELEHRVLRAGGAIGWAFSRAIPVFDAQGEISEWFGASTDITARKRTEANLAFLAEISQDLMGLTNIADTMETLGAKIGAHFGAPSVAFAEVDEAQEMVEVRHAWNSDLAPSLLGQYRIRDFHTEEFRRACRAGETFVVRDVRQDERNDAEALAALGIASFVGVPMLRDGRWHFLLTVADRTPRDWRDDEIELLQEITTRVWTRLERALAEEKLRESEARRHIALEAAALGTFVWYPQEDRGEPDGQMRRLFGIGEGETLNLSAVLARMIHPDDVERYAAEVGRALDPAGDGRLETEIRVIHSDGSLRWIAVVAQTVFDGHQPRQALQMYGTAAEITGRKRSQERQDFLLELADSLRPLADPAAVQAVASRLLAEHLQVERVVYAEIDDEEMIVHQDHALGVPSMVGRHVLSFFGSKAAEEILGGGAFWEENLPASREFSEPEKSIWRTLGVAAYLGATLSQEDRVVAAFSVHSANPRRWSEDEIALVAEVAERTGAALERARAEMAVREADRRKSEFLAMLGHELRNPLAALEGGVRLLQSPRALPESRAAALPIVAQQVAHMKRLIDDVLDLARLDRGKLQVHLKDTDLGATVEASIRMTENLAQAKGSQIRYQPPAAPLRLQADAERLVQVFTNLLTNAIKFSAAGSAIDVFIENDGRALVHVRDYGRGISPEDLAEIFEPFVQSRLSLGLPGAGLGLGLSVSRELVELHGGSITARSAGLDQGSTFVVALPLPSPG